LKELVDDRIDKILNNDCDEYLRNSLLYSLLKSGNLSIDQIKENILTILNLGVDTTSFVITRNLLTLSMNVDIQDKLYNILKDKMDIDGKVTKELYKELSYVDNIIRETHRVYPPMPWLIKKSHYDCTIDDHHIPKETMIIINLHNVQNDPKYIDNPDKFIPERWNYDSVESRKGTDKEIIDHLLFNGPFGVGPRMCLGSRAAKLEIKTLLIKLFRKYKIEALPEQDVKFVPSTFFRIEPFPKLKIKLREE